MAQILEPDYETFRVRCDHCAADSLLNRVTDMDEPGPYSGRHLECPNCHRQFWINSDIAGPAFEMFIHHADEHFRRKRYMLAVALVAQAWEIFFSTFLESRFVFRPFFASAAGERDLDAFNSASRALHHVVGTSSFFDLRNLMMRVIVDGLSPQTFAESHQIIPKLEKLWRDVPKRKIAAMVNDEHRNALFALREVTVGHLRNRVVHHGAYRPTRAEVEPCLEGEVRLLYRLEHIFGVGTFEAFSAGVVPLDA